MTVGDDVSMHYNEKKRELQASIVKLPAAIVVQWSCDCRAIVMPLCCPLRDLRLPLLQLLSTSHTWVQSAMTLSRSAACLLQSLLHLCDMLVCGDVNY